VPRHLRRWFREVRSPANSLALFQTPGEFRSGGALESRAENAPVKANPFWFTNVADRSHFSYKSNNDFTGRKYFPQPMCGGVAAIDYNNDGFMDLFFTNGAKLPELKKTAPEFFNCLLRNRGDGTFEDVTAKAGLEGRNLGFCFGVAVADYDNDGCDDIFICNAGSNTLYHNNGDGTFADVTAGSGLDHKPENVLSVGAAWFDYDNDGRLDLLVTNYTTWTPDTDKECFMAPDGMSTAVPRFTRVSHPDFTATWATAALKMLLRPRASAQRWVRVWAFRLRFQRRWIHGCFCSQRYGTELPLPQPG
jgi:hypothetical protein